MIELTLLPIGRDGDTAEAPETLPELARDVCQACRLLYDGVGYQPPWVGYLVRVGNDIVGSCAFKGAPIEQRAEIAYFTFPEFEGAGFATAMVQRLIAIAIAAHRQPGLVVIAQTSPEETAANVILKKLGFQYRGPVQHPEDGLVWEWALPVAAN
jgi:RimJ/RimL family protein N-acetyltransferase